MTAAVSPTLLESTRTVDAALLEESAPSANQQIDKQEFLTLFIAQLQNQDPLSPLQPEQLTAQLAQFSSLEQLTGINTRLDTLNGTSRQTTTSALLGLIGKEVRYDGSSIVIKDGQAPAASFTLDQAVDGVTATVYAGDGSVVRVVELGALGAGEQSFQLDGRDARGALLADGTYRLEVAAAGKDGAPPTPVTLITTARVDGVDLAADPPALLVGGERVTLDKVRQVHDAPADS
jgi:flagellar basal-body rod modification protein FlgD